jgi:transcriptional regulator with XRE-family HTH domain
MLLHLGGDLRRARLAARLSQDRLARVSHVSQATISRIERGLAPGVVLAKIAMIMRALGMGSFIDFAPCARGPPVMPRCDDWAPQAPEAPVASVERRAKSLGHAPT